MKKNTLAASIIIVILSVAVLAIPFVKLHFIREGGGGGAVLWNHNEAYLFMSDCPDGFVLSIPEYLTVPIREYFYAPPIPVDSKCTLRVFHVTSTRVERSSQPLGQGSLGFFTPIDGNIYADCPGGMCKWSGDKFEHINENEEQKIGGYLHLSKREFSDTDGWSERWIRGADVGQNIPPYKISIEVNRQITLSINGGNPVSVDVQRLNGSSEKVWYHRQSTHWVSRASYQHIFDGVPRQHSEQQK